MGETVHYSPKWLHSDTEYCDVYLMLIEAEFMMCSAFHCVYLGYVGSSTLSKYTIGVGNGRHYCPLVFTVIPIQSKASVHLMFSFNALG